MPHDEEYLEEEYFQTSKDARQERRRARARDRSKFKKTDQAKKRAGKELQINPEDYLRGRVLSIQSQSVTVDSQGKQYDCVMRGIFKLEKTKEKNLVAVGDEVLFEETSEGEGCIVQVESRKTILSRADNLDRRRQQIIATNVDQVLITASIGTPPLKPFLIDRYIIAARKGNMDPIIVINKVDLLETDPVQEVILEDCIEAYRQVDIPVILVSTVEEQGLDELKQIMTGKVSVFSGQSGVGKSSLINAVTGLELATRDVVSKTRKGSHTTTMAQLLLLDFGGWCVDTPGIKSFGVWQLEPEELQDYFTEIREIGQGCRFPNCSHLHEPGCKVQEAVEAGELSEMRFDSYAQLMQSIQEEHKRR